MRAMCRIGSQFVCVLGLMVVCTAFSAQAQERETFVISARAGGVNFVSGDVKVARRGATRWLQLTAKDTLDTGDVVKTGASGLVEVLLNPGAYIRLGGDSEVELTDASLDALRVKLIRGSAVVEATGYSDAKLLLAVATPQGEVMLVRNGLYRLNVVSANITEVAVHKGAARVVPNSKELVKGGKVARLSGGVGMVEVVKLDKNQRDELDLWSRERGETLARANSKLSSRNASALMASLSDYLTAQQSFTPRGAVWFYNPANGCYTALPFYAGWRSPYGIGYGISYAGHAFTNGFGCRSCPDANQVFPNPPGTIVSGNATATGGNPPNPTPNPNPMPRPEPATRDFSSPAIDRGNDRQSPHMASPPL